MHVPTPPPHQKKKKKEKKEKTVTDALTYKRMTKHRITNKLTEMIIRTYAYIFHDLHVNKEYSLSILNSHRVFHDFQSH